MDFKELGEKAVEQLKADAKLAVAHQIELCFMPAAELALSQLKAAIPGSVDDAVIDMVGPKLIELLRAELDKMVAKI